MHILKFDEAFKLKYVSSSTLEAQDWGNHRPIVTYGVFQVSVCATFQRLKMRAIAKETCRK